MALDAGVLHDLGKYTEIFGKRLRNEASGLDHWTAGFIATFQKYGTRFLAAALAIQGHHIGLQHSRDLQAMAHRQVKIAAIDFGLGISALLRALRFYGLALRSLRNAHRRSAYKSLVVDKS